MKKKKRISITCRGSAILPIDELYNFQGNLKTLRKKEEEKLKKSLIKYGFTVPVFIWKNHILDGHQRIYVVKKLLESGYIIDGVPIVHIDATDRHEAAEKLLQINSQYGKIDQEGLKEFMIDFEIDASYLNDLALTIPDLDSIDNFISSLTMDQENTGCSKNEAPKEDALSEKEMQIPFYEWLCGFKKIIVSFSGGKDSMAMVGQLLDHKVPIEQMKLLFCRTSLDYIDLEDHVIRFAKLTGIVLDVIGLNFSEEEKCAMFRRNGWPLPISAWCTSQWKVQPTNKYFRENGLIGNDKIVHAQGWRKEESERRAQAQDRAFQKIHQIHIARPILDFTEQQVYDMIDKYQWPLHNAYQYRERLGCLFCFATKRAEWDIFRKEDPQNFLHALRYMAEGLCSANISDTEARNRIRKMMGLGTVHQALLHSQ